jgi:diguanylate cyclase (GGDEF)-like protein
MGRRAVEVMRARRWWYEPDHYYWMTAVIAARGAQRKTCRRLSAVTIGFGSLALVMLFSPVGPSGPVNRSIAAVAVLVLGVAALGWLRSRWPTRTQSLIFVALSVVCVMVAALTQSNPVSGFVACMSLVALCGCVVFFHSLRYLYPMLAAALVAVVILLVRLFAHDLVVHDLVWAICLTVSCPAVVVPVGLLCQGFVHLLRLDLLQTDIEPLTGLLNRAAFYSATGSVMGSRNRWHDKYLLLIVVSIDDFFALERVHGQEATDRARVAVAQALRETTRSTVVLGHVTGSEFVVVDTGGCTDWQPLAERSRSAIKTTPPGTSVSVGVVTVPLHELDEDLLDALITIATTAMRRARRLGGNHICHVALPAPSVLDQAHPDRLR